MDFGASCRAMGVLSVEESSELLQAAIKASTATYKNFFMRYFFGHADQPYKNKACQLFHLLNVVQVFFDL